MFRSLTTMSLLAVFASIGAVLHAEEKRPFDELSELAAKSPETFEITLLSHFSDDDFGFHIQTAPLPRGDYLYPRFRISNDRAVEIVKELAATKFADNAKMGERYSKFLPAKPMPAGKRVYSVVVRCGDFAFFEDVRTDEEMKKRGAAVGDAFRGLKIGSSFQASFNSKLD